ncbi:MULTISPECIES: alpha/beta hydrolase [unclassified Acidovorax]|uniref:alpha/beta fold hydrolase n=1 Tax=unclassified Acidovorax TaxID=2684926 RepID=UPI002882EC5F|nr:MULTISPECIES: alpha/beta hydrolase [unclassified Acidovorax]
MKQAEVIPLLLLPGLLCDDDVWLEQRTALQDACDITIGWYGTLNRIELMASHMLEVMKAPRFALAGHSMGGRIALEILRQAPERVTGLALLDTGTGARAVGAAGDTERQGRHELLALARSDGMQAMARRWAPPMVHPEVVGTPLFDRIVAMVDRSNTQRFAAQIEALLERPDAEPVLRSVQCPLLLLCGNEDRWSPPDRHQAMHALAPRSTLRLIDHCGHMSPMEQPHVVSAALKDWLQECRNA